MLVVESITLSRRKARSPMRGFVILVGSAASYASFMTLFSPSYPRLVASSCCEDRAFSPLINSASTVNVRYEEKKRKKKRKKSASLAETLFSSLIFASSVDEHLRGEGDEVKDERRSSIETRFSPAESVGENWRLLGDRR